jgi:hypothetical protein
MDGQKETRFGTNATSRVASFAILIMGGDDDDRHGFNNNNGRRRGDEDEDEDDGNLEAGIVYSGWTLLLQ